MRVSCPIPEVARLCRTLRAWRVEFLVDHETAGASNGPTEAMNLLIERSRRDARGFRNFDNYRLRLRLPTASSRRLLRQPMCPIPLSQVIVST
jgi:transposase